MKLVKVFSILALSSLLISSCSTSTSATNITVKKSSLYNTEWKLLNEDNNLVKGFNGENVYLTINQSTLNTNGYAGCNQFSSSIKANENNLSFESIIGTKMTCPNYKTENSFLNLLKNVNRYEIKKNEMYLYKDNILLLKLIN